MEEEFAPPALPYVPGLQGSQATAPVALVLYVPFAQGVQAVEPVTLANEPAMQYLQSEGEEALRRAELAVPRGHARGACAPDGQ